MFVADYGYGRENSSSLCSATTTKLSCSRRTTHHPAAIAWCRPQQYPDKQLALSWTSLAEPLPNAPQDSSVKISGDCGHQEQTDDYPFVTCQHVVKDSLRSAVKRRPNWVVWRDQQFTQCTELAGSLCSRVGAATKAKPAKAGDAKLPRLKHQVMVPGRSSRRTDT